MSRIVDVVDEIGFLTSEYDTLEIENTEFLGDPINTVSVVAYDSHYDMYDWTSGEFPLDFLFEDETAHKICTRIREKNQKDDMRQNEKRHSEKKK